MTRPLADIRAIQRVVPQFEVRTMARWNAAREKDMSGMQRKTRIVATIGPASSSPAMLRRLIRTGVDVVRLNFSHGTQDFFRTLVKNVRDVSSQLGEQVAILQDLSGPKMRVGEVEDDAILLRNGDELEVIEGRAKGVGDADRLFVTAAGAIKQLEKGQPIRLADGLLELHVTGRTSQGVTARVIHGGTLRSRQGVNIPGADLGVKALTAKDKKDLEFGLELGVDAVALSFVQDADDILSLRRLLKKHGANPFVVAKIERSAAMRNLNQILDVTGGVMVARGDLGVEIGLAKVPMAQKRIIREALARRRPVITATQMLESMIDRPSATRAEVSDIANAVFEGSDALMLSGETAVGKHPVEAVRTLVEVAMEAERDPSNLLEWLGNEFLVEDPAQGVTRAARLAARAVGAVAIVGFSDSGRTLRLIASQRPSRAIFGFSHEEATLRRMKMFWGVDPLLVDRARSVETMIADAERILVQKKLVRRGDRLVIVCGQRVHSGATNSLHVHTVGER
jgi:pyruvate kinase